MAFEPDFADWDADGDLDERRPLRWGSGGFAPAWGGRRWELYLDVINALNRRNTAYIDYEHARPRSKDPPTSSRASACA